jgi:hypothetical protein
MTNHTRPTESGGCWHVDFEYSTHVDGSLRDPFLMVAHPHPPTPGDTIVRWGDDLTSLSAPPFPLTDRTYVVCHHCLAEAACFRKLGWPRPNFIDTMVEFRLSPAYADLREEAAMRKRFGSLFKDHPKRQHILRLNQMARALGVPPLYDDAEKEELQRLASTGGPFDEGQKRRLIAALRGRGTCLVDTQS